MNLTSVSGYLQGGTHQVSMGHWETADLLVFSPLLRSQELTILFTFPLLCLLTLQGFFFPFILVDSSENSQDFLTSLLSFKHRLAEVWVGRSSLFYTRVFYLFSCPPHFKVLKTLARICTSSLACLLGSIYAWFWHFFVRSSRRKSLWSSFLEPYLRGCPALDNYMDLF